MNLFVVIHIVWIVTIYAAEYLRTYYEVVISVE